MSLPEDMGLRYFDEVIVVTAGRFTEMEAEILTKSNLHKVCLSSGSTAGRAGESRGPISHGADQGGT